MASKRKYTLYYHQRLFILFLSFVVLTVGCFVYGQYIRERHLKIEMLNEQLQIINGQLLNYCDKGGTPQNFYKAQHAIINNVRITLLQKDGKVIFDSENTGKKQQENHLMRPEIQEALRKGSAYTVRYSQSMGDDYFYAATRGKNYIARTAVAYTVTLADSLKPNTGFILVVVLLSAVFCILCYMMTRHLGDNIRRLREFARKAGAGEQIETEEKHPHDELGEISHQIAKLYNRLLQTMGDLDRERRSAIHEAHEKIRIKRELTNNINHELKTPLAAIKGYLETILSYPDMATEQRVQFTQKSYEQALRLTGLLRDVSTISKLEEGNLSVKRTRVNLTDIFEDLRGNMDMLSDSHQPDGQGRMEFHCNITEPLWMVGDLTLLNSVFENLMNNALAYSSGTDVFIELIEKTDDYYKLSFSDNGNGVEERQLPYLFDRFYRVDKGRSRKLGGTGLGLSIVKNAILHHGGTISVCNGKHGGLEFTFTLSRHLEENTTEAKV